MDKASAIVVITARNSFKRKLQLQKAQVVQPLLQTIWYTVVQVVRRGLRLRSE